MTLEQTLQVDGDIEVEDTGDDATGGGKKRAKPSAENLTVPHIAEAERIILTDSRLPTDRLILEDIDTSREPIFTVSEVSKMFFARSPHWIRWREKKGEFVFDGEDVSGGRTEGGARRYTLSDIERMAHALASRGSISGAQLGYALLLVHDEARLWGYVE